MHEAINPNRPGLFDDGQEERLEALCIRLFEMRKSLKLLAETNPLDYPTPTRLAGELGLTVEETLELIDFVDSDFPVWRMERIEERRRYMVVDGRVKDPLTGEPV